MPKLNRAARREALRAELLAKREEAKRHPVNVTYREACARVEALKRSKPRAWWPKAWRDED